MKTNIYLRVLVVLVVLAALLTTQRQALAVDASSVDIDSVPGKTVDDVYDGGYDVTSRPGDIITKGPWIDVRAYASFGSALSALISAGDAKTLLIVDEQAVTDNVTVPKYITLAFVGGGVLNVASTKTLTISGAVQSPATQIFMGVGDVVIGNYNTDIREVYPEWWGAKGDDSTDSTASIQAAIDALSSHGGVVGFGPGIYQTTALTVQGSDRGVFLRGSGRMTSRLRYMSSIGSCITLGLGPDPDSGRFRFEDIGVYTTLNGNTYGINAPVGVYTRQFCARNFYISGFKTGVYIDWGQDCTIDEGVIECYGGKGVLNGTIGLHLQAINGVCVKDVSVAKAHYGIHNGGSPSVIIRPAFDDCEIGLDNYTRAVVISSSFGDVTIPARMTDNGALFLGTNDKHGSFAFAGTAERNRTSWIPDTFDSLNPLKLGLLEMDHTGDFDKFLDKKWTKGTAAPTSGTWSRGDIRWNTSPSAGSAMGWVCTSGGTPGIWKSFDLEP
jgi:hypothetical protein